MAVVHTPITQHFMSVLENRGLKYVEEPTARIPVLTYSQVRSGEKAAPKTVRVVTDAVRRGDQLPPIVITADDLIVDGRSRVEAYRKNKQTTCYALRLSKTQAELGEGAISAIGSELNKGPANFRPAEQVSNARAQLQAGHRVEVVARDCELPEQKVRGLRAQMDAEAELDACAIRRTGMSDSVLARLGFARGALLDAVWAKTARLTHDAGLSAADVGALVKAVRALPSEAAQLEYLDKEREALSDQIERRKMTGNGGQPASREIRTALGRLFAAAAKPDKIERNPERVREYVTLLDRAAAVLQEIKDEQVRAAV